MTENEKTTALIPSVGADGGQPPHNSTKQRIPHETCESNPSEENIEEMRERIRRMMLIYGKEATTQIENSVPYYSVSKWSSNTKMLLLHFHAP